MIITSVHLFHSFQWDGAAFWISSHINELSFKKGNKSLHGKKGLIFSVYVMKIGRK